MRTVSSSSTNVLHFTCSRKGAHATYEQALRVEACRDANAEKHDPPHEQLDKRPSGRCKHTQGPRAGMHRGPEPACREQTLMEGSRQARRQGLDIGSQA
eukprot:4236849-Pleurochrysis_carterae.AAC.3